MTDTRDLDAEMYENDPSLLVPDLDTEVRRLPPSSKRLGGAIPVRFTEETVDRVKEMADRQGVTVSAWIRARVEDALADLEPHVLIASVSRLDDRRAEKIGSDIAWGSKVAARG